jgi:hypothetical protein
MSTKTIAAYAILPTLGVHLYCFSWLDVMATLPDQLTCLLNNALLGPRPSATYPTLLLPVVSAADACWPKVWPQMVHKASDCHHPSVIAVCIE